ncbi:D-glycero-alpha-D-manno-heptose-1,7-bisphosphate 7-phosphatase [Desulfoferrobacter suflitae]|uniref:D-glycero-alpha-D-manno-heptose-1,7-bisphosphate 7-phosphatase n=1 Tax=Desulfoferrobacter suflitae TaxID=2865782 RepID=UPI0021644893|nr:HAD family hydrolase [Desulfoferrobacter suflitae]MCK8603098.1 HAD family hydrolase [Desulfoferrobacter suflitae]
MLIWSNRCEYSPERYLLLDRDGVINIDRPDYIKHWNEFIFYPDALAALEQCRKQRIGVILISNQSALNRGLISLEDFWQLHHRMVQAIEANGGTLAAAFYCPHRPEERCSCRKPAPFMLLKAAQMFDIAMQEAVMIGDRPTDVQAAIAAGCRAVLLTRELATGQAPDSDSINPANVTRCSNLLAALADLVESVGP